MAFTRRPRSFSALSISWRMPSGFRFKVSGSTSQKIGVAPTCSITCTAEQNVSGEVMTASPLPIPSASRERCNAAVPELTASASGAWTNCAKSCSKRFTFGPVVIQSERRVSTTSLISSSPINGGEKGRNLSRTTERSSSFLGHGKEIWQSIGYDLLIAKNLDHSQQESNVCQAEGKRIAEQPSGFLMSGQSPADECRKIETDLQPPESRKLSVKSQQSIGDKDDGEEKWGQHTPQTMPDQTDRRKRTQNTT